MDVATAAEACNYRIENSHDCNAPATYDGVRKTTLCPVHQAERDEQIRAYTATNAWLDADDHGENILRWVICGAVFIVLLVIFLAWVF